MTVTSHLVREDRSPKSAMDAIRLGIELQGEPVAFVHRDCTVARSEGFTERTRVELRSNERTIFARLSLVEGELVGADQVGLSETAWTGLTMEPGDKVALHHPRSLDSMSDLRAKIYGHRLTQKAAEALVRDIVEGRLSDVQVSAFIAALASQAPDLDETAALTRAMVSVGDRLSWSREIVVDKHCVGGLPGNRTTPIIVAIVAASGLTIPKTSSRAITSPAGTADTMATMTQVDLSNDQMRKVVEAEGGCLVWGGSVRLSPADDILIRVERELELDCTQQLVASVLSKKVAAGSTHVLIDIPVGPTAKVRTDADAVELCEFLSGTGEAFGLRVETVISDGLQPIGNGIGPALEAHDVLAILERSPNAPYELRERSLRLAGAVLELGGACEPGHGKMRASEVLDDGRAMNKFIAICEAQGGFRRPGRSAFQHMISVKRDGRIAAVDNRRLARLAKLAGAPRSLTAGLEIHVDIGDAVSTGQPLLTLHGESRGEIDYALDYYSQNADLIEMGPR